MWQIDLRSFCYSRALKSLAYIWQILRPVWTGTGKYCLNPHLFFVSFRSPRTKMSSCLHLLRKTMRILDPRPEHDIWTLKSWQGPYDSVKHLVTHSYIHELHVETETQYSDTPDRSEDNKWPGCMTSRNTATDDPNTHLGAIWLWFYVSLWLFQTHSCHLHSTALLKGKNALSWLVTSSNTKPCNLNTPASRDNNTGSCVEGVYRWKTALKTAHIFPLIWSRMLLWNGSTTQQPPVLMTHILLNCI